jgi:acyl-CoA hydrolase
MTIWCSLEEAVTAVNSGDRIFIQGARSTPTPLLEALVARGETLHNVEITHLHTYGPTPYIDERRDVHLRLRALFVSANTRAAVNSGCAGYAPIFLSDIPAFFASENGLPLDVAFVQVSPPDAHGYCSLGPSVDVTRAAVDHARHIIALVNPQAPRVHGEGFIALDRIARAVHWDEPLYTVERARADETHTRIGEQVATLIEDGATLQLGIGAIPDATFQALADRRDLGVHSEMFSDGVLDLVERGVITGARKAVDRGKIVASFVIGARRLLDFIDDNPVVELRSADYTNNTHLIRQFDQTVAVNSAIQVDLIGQVCAETIGSRIYSGVGGQMDFMRGAALATRGCPIIALKATAPARAHQAANGALDELLGPVDRQVSRITPVLAPGAGVTTSRACPLCRDRIWRRLAPWARPGRTRPRAHRHRGAPVS